VKRQLKIWKAIVPSLRQANLVRCAVPEHPAVEQYQSLELTDNQRRRDAGKRGRRAKEEGLLVLGQVNALTQQIQRETDDVQTYLRKSKHSLKSGEICASLNITLNIQEDIAPWMNEQEHYERQLYQLSQRLTLQNQLNEQEAQERQYQQQLTATRQTLEHTCSRCRLAFPKRNEAAWLHAREGEFAQWQENKRSTACFRNAATL
jgi:exonuclease SbcC